MLSPISFVKERATLPKRRVGLGDAQIAMLPCCHAGFLELHHPTRSGTATESPGQLVSESLFRWVHLLEMEEEKKGPKNILS